MDSLENNSWTELQDEEPIPQTQSEKNYKTRMPPANIDQTLNEESHFPDPPLFPNNLLRNGMPNRPPKRSSPKPFMKSLSSENSFDSFNKQGGKQDRNRKSSICIIDNIKLQKDSVRKRKIGNPYFQSFNVNLQKEKGKLKMQN